MAFTPGPWEILPNEVCVVGPCPDNDPPTALVAMCGAARREHAENAANARLIKASPALLAACEAALRHLQADVETEVDEGREGAACRLHDQLLAAIAEARGE